MGAFVMTNREGSPDSRPVTSTNLLLLTLILLTWGSFVTGGSWEFNMPEMLGKYYDALGESLLEGRWDVPCDTIAWEALEKDGRCYGYFGPTPAIVRLLLRTLVTPEYHLSRLSVLLALIVQLIFMLWFVKIYRSEWQDGPQRGPWPMEVLLPVLGGLGATTLYLTNPAFLYHEAIAWANAFALGVYAVLFQYFLRPQGRLLFLALLLTAFSLHARFTAGYGALLALAGASIWTILVVTGGWPRLTSWLCRSTPSHRDGGSLRRTAAVVLFLVLFLATTPFLISLAKHGELSLFPLKYQVSYQDDARRLQNIQGSFVQPANLLFNAYHFFNPISFYRIEWFPYFQMGPTDTCLDAGSPVRFDLVEPMLSIPNSMPVLFFLSLMGLHRIFRKKSPLSVLRIPVLGAAAAGGTVLLVSAFTHRYSHDFFPLLFLAGSAGLHSLAQRNYPPLLRILLPPFVSLLVLASLYIGAATALLSPYRNAEMSGILQRIRHHLDGSVSTLDVLQNGLMYEGCNGIRMKDGQYNMIVNKPLPEGVVPGRFLLFRTSGERRITKIVDYGMGIVKIFVEGPLDPKKDGVPNPVKVVGLLHSD
ncbi:MAG: hypothetical protein HQL88_01050 [Magnetococcales bacterium]|nr:hypothetical protein [Magnetococcales bacterium]